MGETLCAFFPIGYLFLYLYVVLRHITVVVVVVVVASAIVAVISLLLLLICTTINAYF